jgi:uracil-DNA glycosylase
VGLAEQVGPGWTDALAPVADDVAAMGDFLRAEQAAGRRFLPRGEDVFAALRMPFDDVRVLVLGQDPYPTPGHPIGLAFAVAPDVRPLPKSLQNIFTELVDDLGVPEPTSGDLTPWVEQGVLLLNRSLTVRPHAPASHRDAGWWPITDHVVAALVARDRPLVAVLWGRQAQSVQPRLQGTPAITAPHPSPLSAHRGFFGSRPFSRTNALLAEQGAAPVVWELP